MKSSKKILILAIIFALITTFLIYLFLNKNEATETSAEKEFVTVPLL